MRWLSERLAGLEQTEADLRARRGARAAGEAPEPEEAAARAAFFRELGSLVEEVAACPGVVGCFAEHDGLLVSTAGEAEAADALAAMACAVAVPARRAAQALRLGPLHQMLMVGEERKLALMLVGELSIGIVAPASLRLSSTLNR